MDSEQGRKRLGEILIEQGVLNQQKLEQALTEQKSKGSLLGEILVRLGFVKEEDIVIALATQFNFPYLPLENFEVNPRAVKLVPVELVTKYLFMPIDKMKTILTVVMSDPSNGAAISEIETASGCHAQPFVGTVTEIKRSIERHYKVVFEQSASAAENLSRITFKSAQEKH